jgi:tetratricopeptide (TPR) repeat protein
MRGITAKDCYRYVRDSGCRMGPEEFVQFNMALLSVSARAVMYAMFLGQHKDARALAFVKIAKDRGTPEEYAYARHLESALAYTMSGDEEGAIAIAQEVVLLARNLGDSELEGDALTGISLIYGERGNMTVSEAYRRRAAHVRGSENA